MTPSADRPARSHVPRPCASRAQRAGWLPLAAALVLAAFVLGAAVGSLLPWSDAPVPVFVAAATGEVGTGTDAPLVPAASRGADEAAQGRPRSGAGAPRGEPLDPPQAAWSGDLRAFLGHALIWTHRRPPYNTPNASAPWPMPPYGGVHPSCGNPPSTQVVQHAAKGMDPADSAWSNCDPPPAE